MVGDPGGFRRGLAAFPPGIPKVIVVARPVGAELLHTRRVEPADHEVFVVGLPIGALERNQDMRIAGEVEELGVELDIQVNGLHRCGVDDEILDLTN